MSMDALQGIRTSIMTGLLSGLIGLMSIGVIVASFLAPIPPLVAFILLLSSCVTFGGALATLFYSIILLIKFSPSFSEKRKAEKEYNGAPYWEASPDNEQKEKLRKLMKGEQANKSVSLPSLKSMLKIFRKKPSSEESSASSSIDDISDAETEEIELVTEDDKPLRP